jgi:tyrocidine synthetase-3
MKAIEDDLSSASINVNIRLKEKKYWMKRLSGDFVKTGFPFDINKSSQDEPVPESFKFGFTEELLAKFMRVSNRSDIRLYIILLTGVVLLLNKYTGSKDIVVGAPVYKQDIEGDFINRILVLRNQADDHMSFKELLLQVSQTNFEAVEHVNYPLETIPYELNISSPGGEFPLFAVAVLLENIHDKNYISHLNLDTIFSFSRKDNNIEGAVRYNASRYSVETVELMVQYFSNLMQRALTNIEAMIGNISVMSDEEFKRLVVDLNAKHAQSTPQKKIHELFQEQVRRTPHHVAVQYKENHLTYRELDEKANRFARCLKNKGIKTETIAAILLEHSPELIIAILAVLKAGGAYLPIDPAYPISRLNYFLEDSKTKHLITRKRVSDKIKFAGITIEPGDRELYDTSDEEEQRAVEAAESADRLAYIIYTSGTTNKPKGVMIQHSSVVNYVWWAAKTYVKGEKRNFPLYSSISFDLTVTSIFTPLITGNAIVIYEGEDRNLLVEKIIEENKVEVMKLTPSHLYLLKYKAIEHSNIKCFIVGGELFEIKLAREIFDQFAGDIEIYNEYGPTEATVGCLIYKFDLEKDHYASVPIGVPIDETQVYILDQSQNPVPGGISGEVYVSGQGIARGYLNSPELTIEKFVVNPFRQEKQMYITGDMARWLPGENLEFLGRKDQQVKIRGYRIELAEIEQQLLRHRFVKEALVMARDAEEKNAADEKQDQYLCAYFVADRELRSSQLRDYLVELLPDYMVPLFFTQLEEIPLTSNGKINRKALPVPEIKKENDYTAPRDEVEKKLVDIWSEVLRVDRSIISIDASFFQLGGQSLKQVYLISQVQKEFNVKLPLAEIFKRQTIRELSGYINGAAKEKYVSIRPVEQKEYYVLSSAQQRMYILRQIDLEGTLYNVPMLVTLTQEIDKEKCNRAFQHLVDRHESLRTSFIMLGNEPVQKINKKVDFKLEYHELESKGALNRPSHDHDVLEILDRFIHPFELDRAPLFRVGLVKLESKKYILMLDIHHIISDGVSTEIMANEFTRLYGGDGDALPALHINYKDYARWQNTKEAKEKIKRSEEYWLKEFEVEIPVLNLSFDYPRPVSQSFEGGIVEFKIGREEVISLNEMAITQGLTTYMVLMAVFNILMSKLSNQEDILVGTPVAGRRHADMKQIIGLFVNTLVLRSYPRGEKKISEYLDEVKTNTLKAFENQEYQFEELLEKVPIERDVSRNAMFDVMFAWISFFRDQELESSLGLKTEENSLNYNRRVSKFDLSFLGMENEYELLFTIEYCTQLFKEETILRFVDYFKRILAVVVKSPALKISQLEIISREEKQRILDDFNDTCKEYPKDKTIHQLFEIQVNKTPGNTAIVFEGQHLSYMALNRKANQLACLLRSRGVKPDEIIGIMVERSVEMIIGIMGILKSGGAYLPIDPEYPQDRIDYMLKDSGAKLLVTTDNLAKEGDKVIRLEGEIYYIEALLRASGSLTLSPSSSVFSAVKNLLPANCHQPPAASLAYVIYTSGSTGRPKGVMIQNHSVANFMKGMKDFIDFRLSDTILSLTTISFDIFGLETIVPLLCGSVVVMGTEGDQMDPGAAVRTLDREKITIFQVTPSRLRLFLSYGEEKISRSFKRLRYLLVGGEAFPENLLEQSEMLVGGKIYNMYGPTETTIWSTVKELNAGEALNIGKPIANTRIYIVDNVGKLQPVEIVGELCIGGDGLARGYLNNPGLTNDKFKIKNEKLEIIKESGALRANIDKKFLEVSEPFFKKVLTRRRQRLYQTGDLARWLLDGNIEFLGRIDHQVKIRGFRVELGEIENRLLNYPGIKGVVVLMLEEEIGDKYICAYVVSNREYRISELREYLSMELPDYMIPSYFVRLEKIPLTPSGKVDRRALPRPEIKAGDNYEAPQDRIEKKLVEIWSGVLGIEKEKIGIDDNFFHLGGHSLKATILVSRIHKELKVNVPLPQIFKTSHIRGLAAFIKNAETQRFFSIEAVEKKEYYILSSAQRRLFVLQQMDENGIGYNLPSVWQLEGDLDGEKFEAVFRELIRRHESLRTSFHMVKDESVQRVDEENVIGHWSLVIGKAREKEIEDIIKNFIKPFDLSRAPLLRVELIKLLHTPSALRVHPSQEGKEDKYFLMVDIHHIISDGMSIGILVREFMELYAGKGLPVLRLQYKDYSEWQNQQSIEKPMKQQEAYWLKEFSGEIPVLDLSTDYLRPSVQDFTGSSISFEIEVEETNALKSFAKEQGVTLFMLVLSLYTVCLSRIGGQEEIGVGTPIAGRRHADLEPLMGMFVNTLALRNFPDGQKSFTHFLQEVKESTVKAFDNQDYLFEDLVEKVDLQRDTGRNPLFDTMFAMQNFDALKIEISGLKVQPIDYETRISKFDLTLTAVETGDNLLFTFEYCTKLFKQETIRRFIGYFRKTISTVLKNHEIRISGIEIIDEEEKSRILHEFNDTAADYPKDKTIHRLFEEQVERTPDRVTLVGPGEEVKKRRREEAKKKEEPFGYFVNAFGWGHLSYRELNERSGKLAGLLIKKGVKADTIVGIMVERSLEMMAGILGILKAGGAYLPIDTDYPPERVQYMLEDSESPLVLTMANFAGSFKFNGEVIDIEIGCSDGDSRNLEIISSSQDMVYMIYTSGSTGRPKGVIVKIEGFLNLLHWYVDEFEIGEKENILLIAPISFDLAQKNLFGSQMVGGRLTLAPPGIPEYRELSEVIYKEQVTLINCAPSVFYPLVELNSSRDYINLKSLRRIILGGEPIQVDKLLGWVNSEFYGSEIVNTYGPTECTDIASFYRIPMETFKRKEIISIGKPISNVKVYILDKYRNLLPVGITGELCIGGIGLSKGYHKNIELTVEKFVEVSHLPEKKVYRTGDLSRWLPDGAIEFMGRIDHQVKIRGYRIELGEIENRLLNHLGIKEAVVLVQEEEKGDKYICAYFVSDKEYGIAELREYLSKELPDYMIPSYFVWMEKIPLTPNGKVDRRSLPKPELKVGDSYTAPRDEIEKKLLELWSEILGRDALHVSQLQTSIGIDDNFFELGGHSLKAAILVSKIHKVFDVKVPLVEIFKMPRIKELAKYIKEKSKDYYISIEPAEDKEYYPLSFAQKRLYILQQMNPDSTAYNMPEIITLAAKFDLGKINETFKRFIKRHESLRTSFHMVNDTPVQVIHDELCFEIEYYQVEEEEGPFGQVLDACGGQSPKSQELRAKSYISSFIRPFDLSKAPLLRVGLIKLLHTPSALRVPPSQGGNADKYLLLVDLHHIISDGVSHEILVRDFLALNEGKNLPPLRVQYKDFSEWQESEKEKKNLKQQEKYWLKEFEGEIPVLELPTDYPRPVEQSFEGNNVNFEMTEKETQELKAMALTRGSTLFMVLAAVVNILLSKLSGQEEIIIGTPIAGRRHADLEKIIGMFVNTLALRNYPVGNRRFRDFLGEVKKRTLMAFENQEYPFEELVDKLSVKRDIGRNPIFDIMFVLQNINTGSDVQDEETEYETSRLLQPDIPNEYENIVQTAKFDLTITAVERDHGLFFSIQYCTKLFKKETIERFIIYFNKIVSIALREQGIRVSEIEIISDVEKNCLLYEFNDTEAIYPKDKSIHQLFEEQVDRTPDHTALTGPKLQNTNYKQSGALRPEFEAFGEIQLSYSLLNEESNRLAYSLIEKGVNPDTIVGIMLERSVEMIIGILAILKSGGAYLPIDPEYPQERIDYMLKDSSAKILLTEKYLTGWLFSSPDPLLNLSEGRNFTNDQCPMTNDPLAYVIYTSGTSGQPKGSLIGHRNVVRLMFNDKFPFDFSDRDVWTLFHSFCFDFSVWEMYGALLYGGKLVIVPKMMARDTVEFLGLLNRKAVTILNQTPSAFYNLINEGLIPHLKEVNLYIRYVIFGGEALNPSKLKIWLEMYPQTRFVNMFGITETTVHVTYKGISEKDIELNISNIGKPISTLSTYILDKYLKPVPVGVTGEICVGGDGVARGYLNRVELTNGKFIENPYKPGDLLYRSGDTGRFLENGDMQYSGRIDHQVKIRGFRVELGEIENRLLKHPGIKEAVLVAQEEEESGGKYLCAYIVSDRNIEYESAGIREFLLKELPDYMIPSYFMRLEKIPLTPNGKVDRKALPKPELKASESYKAPGNEIEKKLVELWSEILGRDALHASQLQKTIGINDNFFELGGHSLKATVLASKIHKEWDIILPLVEIFKSPTIMKLGEYIINTNRNIQRDIGWNLVLLKEGSNKDKHLFFIHDGSGEVEGYVEFCKQITNDFNCWGLRADRLESLAPRNVTIRELAETYIDAMKKIQPHGPYYIAGWSLGGTIAFEIALQLEKNGEEVSFLGLIDAPGPQQNWGKEANPFSLESEINWVWEYLPDNEIKEKVKELRDINEIWSKILDHLEENNIGIEIIRQLIPDHLAQIIPNYNRLGIKELIYYMNLNRTLSNARSFYIPSQRLHTNLHYFKASESPVIFQDSWDDYCINPIKSFERTGDHFSIFNKPKVVQTAKIFNNVMLDIINS